MSQQPRKRRDWIRDLPMVAGLALSAAVVVASTTAGSDGPKNTGLVRAPQHEASTIVNRIDNVVDSASLPDADAGGESSDAGTSSKPKRKRHTPKESKAAAGGSALDALPSEATSGGGDEPAVDEPATDSPADEEKPASSDTKPATEDPATEDEPEAEKPEPKRTPIVNVTGKKAEVAAGDVTFALTADGHGPHVGERWSMAAAAVGPDGSPLNGKVSAHVLFQGKVVRHVDTARLRRGGWRYSARWPQQAAGFPITIRVVVEAGGEKQTFLFDVSVRPA